MGIRNTTSKKYIYVYVYNIFMARTIAVSDEVYVLLKKNKLPNESFSKAIKRNVKKSVRLIDIAGTKILTKEDWTGIEKHLKNAQKKALESLMGN
jgi:predicted CopG family antitoxin